MYKQTDGVEIPGACFLLPGLFLRVSRSFRRCGHSGASPDPGFPNAADGETHGSMMRPTDQSFLAAVSHAACMPPALSAQNRRIYMNTRVDVHGK